MRKRVGVLIFIALTALVCAGLAQEQTKSHVVKKGDTLWDLSTYYLQNPFLWPDIYQANKDKIEDPHWIYPGQEFVIPPYPGVMTIMTITAPAPSPVPSPAPAVTPVPEAAPAPEEEAVVAPVAQPEQPVEAPALPKVIYETPVVARELAYNGGYLATDGEITGGYIIESEPPKSENLASHMSLCIDRGSSDGVKIGDRFTVFRVERRINHPRTGKYLGKLIRILGTVRVTDVEEKTSRAAIDDSYDIIKIKDRIKPYEAEQISVGEVPQPVSETAKGYLVARRDLSGCLRPFDIVFIDQGSAGGVRVGDIFDIYRAGKMVNDPATGARVRLPDDIVGSLQVLKTKEKTATAYIIGVHGVTDIKAGETIRLVSRVGAGG